MTAGGSHFSMGLSHIYTSWKQRHSLLLLQTIFPHTANGDCSHGVKRCLLLGRKAMTNLDSILKSRDITLPTTVHIVKAIMVFPVVVSGCESWTIEKTEHRRIDAFELWCWRRLLRVPWSPRRSNQLILKEINPEYSLEWLMLKLKLQYFGHLMWKADTLEKTGCWERLRAGGEGDDRGWDGWMASLTQWTWAWASSRSGWWTGKPGVLQSMGSQRVRHDWGTERNWNHPSVPQLWSLCAASTEPHAREPARCQESVSLAPALPARQQSPLLSTTKAHLVQQ